MAGRARARTILIPIFESIHETGNLFISNGNHEIFIKTKCKPLEVWLSFVEFCGIPVCGGNIDKIGCSLLPDGFVISAQIYSNSREIKWQATLEEMIDE